MNAVVNATFNPEDKGESFFNTYKISPLMLAAKYGNVDIVLALIQAGANINYTPRAITSACCGYYTPLLIAIHVNHKNIIKTLIEHGVDINASFMAALKSCDQKASNILSYAHAYHSYKKTNYPFTHKQIIKTLISYGANVNCIFSYPFYGRKTPLMVAAATGNHSIVKMLLEQGAEINHCEESSTALTDAIYSKKM